MFHSNSLDIQIILQLLLINVLLTRTFSPKFKHSIDVIYVKYVVYYFLLFVVIFLMKMKANLVKTIFITWCVLYYINTYVDLYLTKLAS